MKVFFNKTQYKAIKGLAIVLMFVHHLFTFPGFWTGNIYYPSLVRFADFLQPATKICVAIFVFMSGYLFFYSSDKSFTKSCKKILRVYIVYWIITLPLYIVSLVTGAQSFKLGDFILEMLAIDSDVISFNWYVVFYAIFMLLFPLIDKYLSKKALYIILAGIVAPMLIGTAELTIIPNPYLCVICASLRGYFPVLTIGYICAKYDVYSRFDKLVEKIKYKAIICLVTLIAMAICFVAAAKLSSFTFVNLLHARNVFMAILFHSFDFNMDILYAPIFCYSFFKLLKSLPKWTGYVIYPVVKMGECTLGMWLLSGMFFSINAELFQKYLYWPGKSLFVLIWGLLIMFIPAFLIEFVMGKIKWFQS